LYSLNSRSKTEAASYLATNLDSEFDMPQIDENTPQEPVTLPANKGEFLCHEDESPEKSLVDACEIFRRVLADKLLDDQAEIQELFASVVKERCSPEVVRRFQTPEFFPGLSLSEEKQAVVIAVIFDEMWGKICSRVKNDLRQFSLEEAAKVPSPPTVTVSVAFEETVALGAQKVPTPFYADHLLQPLSKIGLSICTAEELKKKGLITILDLLNLSQKAVRELPLAGTLWRQELRNKLLATHPGLVVFASPLILFPGFTRERCKSIESIVKMSPVSFIEGRFCEKSDLPQVPVDNGFRLWLSDPRLPTKAGLSADELRRLKACFEVAGLSHRW
jgi:hypothetical protein